MGDPPEIGLRALVTRILPAQADVPAPRPARGAAVNERSRTTTPHPTDAPDRRQSRRAEAQTSSQPITAQSFTPTRTPPTTPRLAAGAQNPGTQGFPGSSPRILRPFLRLV